MAQPQIGNLRRFACRRTATVMPWIALQEQEIGREKAQKDAKERMCSSNCQACGMNESVRGIRLIEIRRGGDQRSKGFFIERVPFMEIDGSPRVAFEAGIE